MTKKSIIWFRQDLRLNDNPALTAACKSDNIIPVFILDDTNPKEFELGSAKKVWLHHSLQSFNSSLSDSLSIFKGDPISILTELIEEFGVDSVFWNRCYQPWQIKRDKEIKNSLSEKNINCDSFNGSLLWEPWKVLKNDGTPFKVFTPFWRTAEQIYLNQPPSKNYIVKKKTKAINFFKNSIDLKNILPNKKWYEKFDKYWKVSENDSQKILKDLLENKIKDYGTNRDIPSINGTSRLSPYLKFGQIHVNTIWKKCSELKSKGIGYRKYINELGWREFSHSLINYFPEFLKGNFRKEFDKFPWAKNEKFLKAWKKGMTGYPIVDAGMRELYETGWMHNRIRMVVGSFLVKHLRINWIEGEKHFRNCLLDFNKANNVAQWQWVAGCGADAAPYFRIFNPILQGEKFDKEGIYVKKWVPELNKVPAKFIHKPWEMEIKYQEAIKTIIGKDYPQPIVIHEKARAAALDAFQSLKKK